MLGPDGAVSVLVCTRDRRPMLDRLLRDLRAQHFDGEVEIVVVEETGDPRPIAGVVYVPLPVRELGIAYARNRAVEHASHERLVFVDDDCRVGEDWLQRLLAPLADAGVLGLQGGVAVPDGTGAIGWAESLLGFPGGGISRVHRAGGRNQDTREVSTLNAAYRRSAIARVGGFPESARFGGEDDMLAKRVAAQGRLLFVPGAMARHEARGSLPAVWRWFVRRGQAQVDLIRTGAAPTGYRRHVLRSSLSLKLVPALATVPWLGWSLPCLLLAMIALATWWRLRWAFGREAVPRAGFWVAPLVRLTMDAGIDAGRLRRLLSPRGEAHGRHGACDDANIDVAGISQFSDFVGGGEHSLLELMAQLPSPWRPRLIVPAAGPLAEAAQARGIDVACLPMPRLGPASLPALWRWFAWLRDARPALLHANNARAAVYAGLAGRLLGIPMVFHCRIIEPDRRLDWLIARLSRRIVANSHATARRFAPRFARKVATIYNGIAMPPAAAAVERPAGIGDERIVLCVARVSRWKRHDLVLEAFARLAETVPGLHLVMLGAADPSDPAWMETLKRRAAAMACRERIHWLGQRDDISGWYRIADALILASRPEPFGRVVVEAMASGVPVVAANAGGPAEIMAHGESGVLVDADTPAAWADALRLALAHDDFRQRIIDGARRRAADFSLDRHVEAMRRLYAGVLGVD